MLAHTRHKSVADLTLPVVNVTTVTGNFRLERVTLPSQGRALEVVAGPSRAGTVYVRRLRGCHRRSGRASGRPATAADHEQPTIAAPRFAARVGARGFGSADPRELQRSIRGGCPVFTPPHRALVSRVDCLMFAYYSVRAKTTDGASCRWTMHGGSSSMRITAFTLKRPRKESTRPGATPGCGASTA